MERIIRDKIKEAFNLSNEDIRITVGSENGADVKLSKKGKIRFPFSIECKNQEGFTSIYKHYEQAKGHEKDLIPLLLIKSNHKPILAVLDFDYLLSIMPQKDE